QKLLRAVSTPGLLEEGARTLGEYRGGIDTSAEGDASRGRYAHWILESKRPSLLLLHLSSLDHQEHETGPFSPEAIATLEKIDAIIGTLRRTAEEIAPGRAYFAVVSDHGFAKYDRQLNLFVAFRDAKLLMLDGKGKIADWKAIPWTTGGSAAIVVKNPEDAATLRQVRELLERIAGDPANGIERVFDAAELHQRGGYPPASFFVSMKPGWRTGNALDGPMLSKVQPGGTHGETPDEPELRASFFLVGPGVPATKDLGVIDMRDIAPTLAHETGLSLPSADGKNLLPQYSKTKAGVSLERATARGLWSPKKLANHSRSHSRPCTLPLELENALHAHPFLALLCSWQGLLKSPHQPLPFLHLRICLIRPRLCLKRKLVVHFHDHEKPRSRLINLHVFDSRVANALGDLRPNPLVISPVF